MAIKLYGPGDRNCAALINKGLVDKHTPWSLSPPEENAMLGTPPDYKKFGKMHLGEDDSQNAKSKARYRYPFGKGGKVYRSALIAIRQRAAQQNDKAIYDAAGRHIDKIDGKDKKDSGK